MQLTGMASAQPVRKVQCQAACGVPACSAHDTGLSVSGNDLPGPSASVDSTTGKSSRYERTASPSSQKLRKWLQCWAPFSHITQEAMNVPGAVQNNSRQDESHTAVDVEVRAVVVLPC